MALKTPLYQVRVETRDGREIAVGPKVIKDVADQFCLTVRQQIVAGREKSWSNPHVALCIF